MRGRTIGVVLGLVLALAATEARAAAPIMPLGEVKAGMRCMALSVFRGQAIEPFDVEVIDVIGQATSGGSAPRILVRVSGERVQDTGIGPGFSGSPVFCNRPDGTVANAGAISETIGEYGGFKVLVTPIEQVLDTPVKAPRPRTGILRHARPLAAPLTVSGLNRSVMRGLTAAGARRGVAVLAAPSVPADSSPTLPMRPGSAMAVGLSSGDLSVAGIGTVTYVDGRDVWSYGHQFDGLGARELFLQDANVATVINNPVQADGFSTYKLAGAVHDRGTLTSDGFSAVAGRLGGLPRRTAVRVVARDEDRRRTTVTRVAVADESDVGNPAGISPLSSVAPLAITNGATDVLGASPQQVAGRMCMTVELRERRKPLRFCNRYVDDGVTSGETVGSNPVAQSAGLDAATALAPFDLYKGRPVHITRATARVTQTRAQRQAYLRAVRLPRRVRRGTTVPVKLVVRVVRGPLRAIRLKWRVPRRLEPGERRLRLRGTDPDSGGGGGGLFDEIVIDLSGEGEDESVDTEGPRTVKALARAFRATSRWDGVRAKGLGRFHRDAEYRIGGRASARIRVLK